MKQKIKVVLFLITVAGFPLTATAGYIGNSDDHWKGWSNTHDHGDWFADFGHGKSSKGDFEKHGSSFKGHFYDKVKWGFFDDKFFDIRDFDFKWLHVDDSWFRELLDRLGWKFDDHKPHARVPEPASLILLATGILLIAGARKSR